MNSTVDTQHLIQFAPQHNVILLFLSACYLFLLVSPSTAQDVKVLTNHIGYEKSGPKQAVILGHQGDELTAFKLIDLDTGKAAVSGKVAKAGPVDQWHDWIFWTADFSDATDDGRFLVECETPRGPVRSDVFAIQKGLLARQTLSDAQFYFKDARSTGQNEKADRHLQFEDSFDKGKKLDLHGGWADATGDAGKHLSHLNFAGYFNPQQIPLTTWALFECYDALKASGDRNFRQLERRALDEALYGADYLYRAKNPHGSFYRSVDDPGGGNAEKRFVAKDGSGGIFPKQKNSNPLQTGDMSRISETFLYEVSSRCGGAMSVAALARASTFKDSGEFSSADYLKAARDGFDFLQANNLTYTNDGKENIIDDYCILMAATELFKATKDARYRSIANERAENLMKRLTTSGSYENYWRADDGDRPFFHASDAGLPVVALLRYFNIADEAAQARVLETIKKSLQFELRTTSEVVNPFGYAREFVQSKNGSRRTAFFFPHDSDVSPWWQGENARIASLATAARMAAKHFTGDKEFHKSLEKYAINQLNWILGLNPYDSCMLHGSGRNNPEYAVASYEYIGAPGGICNGITSGLDNAHDIAFSLDPKFKSSGDDWRWNEQWLPHTTWFMLAVVAGE